MTSSLIRLIRLIDQISKQTYIPCLERCLRVCPNIFLVLQLDSVIPLDLVLASGVMYVTYATWWGHTSLLYFSTLSVNLLWCQKPDASHFWSHSLFFIDLHLCSYQPWSPHAVFKVSHVMLSCTWARFENKTKQKISTTSSLWKNDQISCLTDLHVKTPEANPTDEVLAALSSKDVVDTGQSFVEPNPM